MVRIKENMTYKIAKKDVPKVKFFVRVKKMGKFFSQAAKFLEFIFFVFFQSAKFMFVVREPSQRKESTVGTRKAQSGRFFYWGLISIVDHQ